MEITVYNWWVFLTSLSFINIILWFLLNKQSLKNKKNTNLMVWLCFIYVIVCAYRSILPRADVQRMMLFDTWFSSVLLGRTAATIAELAFVAQWVIILKQLSKIYHNDLVKKISLLPLPLITVAEVFSWYGVTIGFNMAHAIEETLWGITFSLILLSFIVLMPKFDSSMKKIGSLIIVGCLAFGCVMFLVDVPMYYKRYLLDIEAGKSFPDLTTGLSEITFKSIVSWEYGLWKDEIPWMTGYFTMAVYSSLGLCVLNKKLEKPVIADD